MRVEQPNHTGRDEAMFRKGQQAGFERARGEGRRRAEMEGAFNSGAQEGAAAAGRQILAGLSSQPTQQVDPGMDVSPEEEIASLIVDAQSGSQEAGAKLNEIAANGGEQMINSVAGQLNNMQGTNGGEQMPAGGDVVDMIIAAQSGDQAAGDALNGLAQTPEGEALINEAMMMVEHGQGGPTGPQAGMGV